MTMYRYGTETSDVIKKKVRIFAILVVVSFLCLWMRIWYLQILKWQYLTGLSENNRVRMVTLPANRGIIKDRKGETLVSIRPAFNLYLTPEDAGDLTSSLDKLSQIIFSPGPLIFKLRKALKDFSEGDYLLLTGDPAIIGVACSIVSDMTNGKYNLLKWDKQEKQYYPIEINLHEKGKIDD